MQWTVLENAEAVAQRACDLISDAAGRAIGERGCFSIVLAGGSTPKRCYELLSSTRQDWERWQVCFGDERCLPRGHTERNSTMARDALLARVPIPAANVHLIPGELGPEAAAAAYANTVEGARPFDLVLLGMGEDGHTASLFPGQPVAKDKNVIPVFDAPKPPPERVTLSPDALTDCRELVVLVTGASKQVAVAQWRSGTSALPVARILPRGRGEVLLDRAASGNDEHG